MYQAHIYGARETREGTVLEILIPCESKADEVQRLKNGKEYLKGSVYFEDGRHITGKQQRAVFAIIRDMADWWADDREYTRKFFQEEFCAVYDVEAFSLAHNKSNCASVTLARNFITFLLEECLKHGVALRETGLSLTDDIERYLWLCLKYGKCCVCGKDGEIHHVDAIGMGRDRTVVNDSRNLKTCLCRTHHTKAHREGWKTFSKANHIYGLIFNG